MVKKKEGGGHHTALHYAAAHPESLKTILALYPENQRLEVVKEKDGYRTVLHYAAEKNPESLKTILALYPENQRLEAVKEKNKSGSTVLHCAASNPESFNVLLNTFPIHKACTHPLRHKLLDKLMSLEKLNSIRYGFSLHSHKNEESYSPEQQQYSSLTKFFQGEELSEVDIATLKAGEVGVIFSEHLSPETLDEIFINPSFKPRSP